MKQYIKNINNILLESKLFLEQLNRCGIILSAKRRDGNDYQTILYEQGAYIIIIPEGKKEDALLYGDWDEALLASRNILINKLDDQEQLQVSIQQYLS